MLGVLLQSSNGAHAHLHFLHSKPPKPPTFKLFHTQLSLSISTEPSVSKSDAKTEALFSLFKDYGFSSDQSEWIFHKNHRLLSAAPDRTIRPKLDYLLTFGYSKSELVTLISFDPHVLGISLERRLIHNLNLLKALLGSEDLVKKAISRSSRLLRCNLEKTLVPNVEVYRHFGVPDKRIVQALVCFPRTMTHSPDVVINVANQLKKLGVNPSVRAFIVGINAKIAMTQPVWDRKKALYSRYGWSEANFNNAFLKHPYCMLNSEGKIEKMMEFFVGKLGWDPVFLSEKPLLIDLSLEKRVIPRCSVLNVLAERGLLGVVVSLPTIFLVSEARFEERYVVKYLSEVPAVVPAYQERNGGEFKALRLWEERKKSHEVVNSDRQIGFVVNDD